MKVGTAFVFICVGIYIAYNYPQVGQMLYGYIQIAVAWIIATWNQINGG